MLLGGAPFGLMDAGARLIYTAADRQGEDWILIAMVLGAGCTGGAVLRASGRVFLGLGEVPGEEARGPSDEENEKPRRPLWLVMLPVSVFLLLAIAGGRPRVEAGVLQAASRFIAWDGVSSIGPVAPPSAVAVTAAAHPIVPWLTLGLAVLIAACDLGRAGLPGRWRRAGERVLSGPVLGAIDRTHDGAVGDYVVWIMIGLALFSVSSAAALHGS